MGLPKMSDSPFDDAADLGEPAESVDSGSNNATSWAGRLFDGDAPGPPLAELEADYDLPREVCIVLRGVLRVANGSGVPPIAEIMLGIVIYVVNGSGSTDGAEGESVNIDGLPGDMNG
jgi:hypothetical protein